MIHNNKNPNRHAPCDPIASQIEPFMAGLEAAGYAANTLCTKRASLRRFVDWRRRLKHRATGPNESEVTEFMARACRLGPKRSFISFLAAPALPQADS